MSNINSAYFIHIMPKIGGGGGGGAKDPSASPPPPPPPRSYAYVNTPFIKKAVKKSGISHVPSLKQPKFGAILWACCNISLPLLRISLRKRSSRLEGQWRNGLQSYENTKIYSLMLIPCHKTVRFQARSQRGANGCSGVSRISARGVHA